MMTAFPKAYIQPTDPKRRTRPALHPCSPQQGDIERLVPEIRRGVRQMTTTGPLAPDADAGSSSAILVDRGCGRGPNTIRLSEAFVSAVRQHSSASPVTIHNDRPHEGIASLSEHLASWRRSSAGISRREGTFPLVAAGSFLDRLVPVAHMVASNAVAHWLDLTHASAMPDAALLHNADECFASIAERQWRTLLEVTARELVPGGKLIFSFMGCASTDTRDQHAPLRLLRNAAERVATQAGLPPEFGRSVVPIYLRTRAETLEPLIDDPEIASRFQVDYCKVESIECPYFSHFRRIGDAEEFARDFTRFVRRFSEWSVVLWLEQLFNHARLPCTVSDQLEQFYSDIEQAVREDPLRWQMSRNRVVLVATRTTCD